MADIREFTITGLATQRKTLTCSLHPDVNIFFGANGSGKTSLLKILNSAMSNDASTLANVPFDTAVVSLYVITSDLIHTRQVAKSSLASHDERQLSLTPVPVALRSAQLTAPREPVNWSTVPPYSGSPTGGVAHRYLPTTRLYLAFQTRRLTSAYGDLV